MVPRWVTDFVLRVFSFSSFYLSFHLQGDKGSRGEKVRTARMLGGDLCVSLLGDPRLHLQLLMLGMYPHICRSCHHCLCQEQGSNGISHVAADTSLGVRPAPHRGHSQAGRERLRVSRGMANACVLRPSCCGDHSTVGGCICSAWGPNSLSFPLQGSRGAKGAKVSLCFCTIYFFWLIPEGRRVFGNHFCKVPVLCFRVRRAGVESMALTA